MTQASKHCWHYAILVAYDVATCRSPKHCQACTLTLENPAKLMLMKGSLVPFLRTKDANQQHVTALILYALIMIMLCEITSESNANTVSQ